MIVLGADAEHGFSHFDKQVLVLGFITLYGFGQLDRCVLSISFYPRRLEEEK